jgi:hypothetical protein
MRMLRRFHACAALVALWAAGASAESGVEKSRPVTIRVDTRAVLHRINPDIYGVSFATADVLRDLNLPLDRSGGNSATLYDWRSDARNAGADYYFESLPVTDDIFDQFNHGFVAQAKAGGARPILTIPAIGWTAKLGPDRAKLAGFSVSRYGRQQAADTQWFPDAGNGRHPDGTAITVNDPNDAARPVDIAAEAKARVTDLVQRWGTLPYYAIDNEPGLWHDSHRMVQKIGVHAEELAQRSIAVARAIRSADPGARIIAPESWGWPEYLDSGFDVQGRAIGRPTEQSDRVRQTGGMDHLPWLLERWRAAGHPVDIVSVHYYPQGGEYGSRDAGGRDIQLLRNRSTRALWDATYRDTSWIGERIALIPRLRNWVDVHYRRDTPIAITEYDWGGEDSMSGATAQADIWGIFGRFGLDMGVRWSAPKPDTPVYAVMRLIRNPDGHGGGFGEGALAVTVPDPDSLSAFAARRDDGAMTLLVINKSLDEAADVHIELQGFAAKPVTVKNWQLSNNMMGSSDRAAIRSATLTDHMAPQSIALYVISDHDR